MSHFVKIVTIYDPNPDYGNRLQNYAVQTVIEKLGFDTATISFQKKIYEAHKLWSMRLTIHRLTGYRLTVDEDYWKYMPQRLLAFDKFNRKYIHTQRVRLIEDIGDADYFVVSSDQVWNPTQYHEWDLKKDIFLLTFTRPKKKVCFSPGFGIDKLPVEWVPWFRKHLASFPGFSVREESDARLIRELTGRDAIVTIDPTLMLDQEDWLRIASEPKKVDCAKPYILTYFPGGRSAAIDAEIREYAAEIGAEAVYHLMDYAQPELFAADPSEFIYLIANAQLVLTDSFCACVFSFLLGNPFLCYDRPEPEDRMNSRMKAFLDQFDLQRKYVNSGLPNELLECNYSAGYAALRAEREKLLHYLKTAMGL